jgi:hypothetical protein
MFHSPEMRIVVSTAIHLRRIYHRSRGGECEKRLPRRKKTGMARVCACTNYDHMSIALLRMPISAQRICLRETWTVPSSGRHASVKERAENGHRRLAFRWRTRRAATQPLPSICRDI